MHELSKYSELVQQQLDQERADTAAERKKRKDREDELVKIEQEGLFLKKKYDAIDVIQTQLDDEQRVEKDRLSRADRELHDVWERCDLFKKENGELAKQNDELGKAAAEFNNALAKQEHNCAVLMQEKSERAMEVEELVRKVRTLEAEKGKAEGELEQRLRQIERLKKWENFPGAPCSSRKKGLHDRY